MSRFVELLACELTLPPSGELLYRQVTFHNWDSDLGKPSSAAFGPATIDSGMPSFSRSMKVSPQESRDWHQHNARSPSMGTWACSAEEVHDVGTRSVDDCNCSSTPQKPRSPGHCYIDYRHYTKGDERIIRGLLLAAALKRGEIYTIDCQVCLKLAELSPGMTVALRDDVEEWVRVNGRKPSGGSDDLIEQRYAETLAHMHNKWADDTGGTQTKYES